MSENSNAADKDKPSLMNRFLNSETGKRTKNFLYIMIGGNTPKKKKKKKQIELNPDGPLGGLRRRNEAMQKQLDELDK